MAILNPESRIPANIALVYPDKLPGQDQRELKSFYDTLIPEICDCPEVKELTIVHRPGLKEWLTKQYGAEKVRLFESNNVQTIWIRDWAPIATAEQKSYKAKFFPQYYSEKEESDADIDHQVGVDLAKDLQFEVSRLSWGEHDLYLDGGNFIHNGNGVGITTNRVIGDNENLSIEQIKSVFQEQLGIQKLIILPVEPGDDTGHIDGMVRFLDENTVVVGDYPTDYEEGKAFLDRIAARLCEEHFNVVRVMNQMPEEQKNERVASAYGNYVNFLRVGNHLFLPQYGSEYDEQAKNTLDNYYHVIPLNHEVDKLARLGGVLNCITWTY